MGAFNQYQMPGKVGGNIFQSNSLQHTDLGLLQLNTIMASNNYVKCRLLQFCLAPESIDAVFIFIFFTHLGISCATDNKVIFFKKKFNPCRRKFNNTEVVVNAPKKMTLHIEKKKIFFFNQLAKYKVYFYFMVAKLQNFL